MKVLITGEHSYAGRQFSQRVSMLNKDWVIDYISVRNNEWKDADFSIYDAIYHVAGIVHQKEKADNEKLYFEINRDLTYQLAMKAKTEGVKSLIFLSSIAVYGLIGKIGENTIISKKTTEIPTSYYGKSKLEAEELLKTLQSNNFNIVILRIPMIYGLNCPGNYTSLSKLVQTVPFFPKVNNKRSLIFVDHLTDVVIHLIESKLSGLYLVKNNEDINTLDMVKEIAKNHNKRVYYSSLLGFIVRIFGNKLSITRKMFGNVFFKSEDCKIDGFEYKKLSFEESIARAEGKERNGND